MKNSHLASLLQEGFTTVKVMYGNIPDLREGTHTLEKRYTFKTFLDLKPGDVVVVPDNAYNKNYSVAMVNSVDAAPDIDFDADFEYKWIIDKVNMEQYEKVLQTEEAQVKALQKMRAEQVRQTALEGLKAVYGNNLEAVKQNVLEQD